MPSAPKENNMTTSSTSIHQHGSPMPLATAKHYAQKFVEWLTPFCVCERLQIAGSIRRARPICNDIDIVAIPKVTEQKDMLGAVISRTNHCLKFLQDYIAARNPSHSMLLLPRFICGGAREGKQVRLQFPKCQLDLWFADEATFGTRLLCRTGSMEHNIWLCQRAEERGLHWDPYHGLTDIARAEPVEASTEEQLYAALGLKWIDPKNRELPWLKKTIDSGL